MGINRKEIVNKVYKDNKPIMFEYNLKGIEGPNGEPQELRIWFEVVNPDTYGGTSNNKPTYKVFTIIDDITYSRVFTIPKSDLPIETVIAAGLMVLKIVFQEDAAYKEQLSYMIGDITNGM